MPRTGAGEEEVAEDEEAGETATLDMEGVTLVAPEGGDMTVVDVTPMEAEGEVVVEAEVEEAIEVEEVIGMEALTGTAAEVDARQTGPAIQIVHQEAIDMVVAAAVAPVVAHMIDLLQAVTDTRLLHSEFQLKAPIGITTCTRNELFRRPGIF
mmetsp:Transcript_1789/g.2728  ORF Transcript_1789/g.2728 Transcript_1789/m.2728 type:complete len:153 (+) Transcript_1789:321-779(+)